MPTDFTQSIIPRHRRRPPAFPEGTVVPRSPIKESLTATGPPGQPPLPNLSAPVPLKKRGKLHQEWVVDNARRNAEYEAYIHDPWRFLPGATRVELPEHYRSGHDYKPTDADFHEWRKRRRSLNEIPDVSSGTAGGW